MPGGKERTPRRRRSSQEAEPSFVDLYTNAEPVINVAETAPIVPDTNQSAQTSTREPKRSRPEKKRKEKLPSPQIEQQRLVDAKVANKPEFVRVNKRQVPDLTKPFDFFVVDENADPVSSIIEPGTRKRLRRATDDERIQLAKNMDTRGFDEGNNVQDAALSSDRKPRNAKPTRQQPLDTPHTPQQSGTKREAPRREERGPRQRHTSEASEAAETLEMASRFLQTYRHKTGPYAGRNETTAPAFWNAARGKPDQAIERFIHYIDNLGADFPREGQLHNIWRSGEQSTQPQRETRREERRERNEYRDERRESREVTRAVEHARNLFDRFIDEGETVRESYFRARRDLSDPDIRGFRPLLRADENIDQEELEEAILADRRAKEQPKEKKEKNEYANIEREIDEMLKKRRESDTE